MVKNLPFGYQQISMDKKINPAPIWDEAIAVPPILAQKQRPLDRVQHDTPPL
jgi:hypothetical protein